jgi:hypothetical protein
MSDDTDALMALKNAWNGALATSDRLREAGHGILGLPPAAVVQDVDLETAATLALAHANAAQALRGLIERVREKTGK